MPPYKAIRHGDYEYRFMCCYGLERRHCCTERYWSQITPQLLASFDADELRACAEAMDGDTARKEPGR